MIKKNITFAIILFFIVSQITPAWASSAERACLSVVPDADGMSDDLKNNPALNEPHDASWWQDPHRTNIAISIPIFALRREENDPGIGKFTDIEPYFRNVLSKQGVNTVLFLPHYQSVDQGKNTSPYAAVSIFAVNELYIDWSVVPEVAEDVHLQERLKGDGTVKDEVYYDDVLCREEIVALRASDHFNGVTAVNNVARRADYQAFVSKNVHWLEPYADFMIRDYEKQGVIPRERWKQMHYYAQWIGYSQLKAAIEGVKSSGGHPLFDLPMFRSINGVEVSQHPGYFKDVGIRFPGIVNQWQTSRWTDLVLWNWATCKEYNYSPALEPLEHWLKFGFEGVRHDGLHFAYQFGNGQVESGDEPGDDYVAAVSAVIKKYNALPVAEAYEEQAWKVERFGFIALKNNDWNALTSHDGRRHMKTENIFREKFHDALAVTGSGRNARFICFTLGDMWGDTKRIKYENDGKSIWQYRIPDFKNNKNKERVRFDAAPFLRAWYAKLFGYNYDMWQDTGAIHNTFIQAGDTFIKHTEQDGETVVEIWAASRDWFFEEWGRDTFIALPGLLLAPGRFDEARSVFRHFARYERGGLIPNRIFNPAKIEYNTVDGSLWFIQAIRRYYEYTGDWAFVKEMAPVIRKIVTAYSEGTAYYRYGHMNHIYMDKPDCLIMSPAQSTWMDADPEGKDQPITPRNGKAVEINALWYGALQFISLIEYDEGNITAAEKYMGIFDTVRVSFNERFWNESEKALRDVIDGDAHSGAIRPNMLYAISQGIFKEIPLANVPAAMHERLTVPLLSAECRTTVLASATQDLLTPYGLRTLSPRDSHYNARYFTNEPPSVKDQAYHQGTAWPFLMGAYIDSLVQVRRDQRIAMNNIRNEIKTVLTPLIMYLLAKSPYGSINEVFDGGEKNVSYFNLTAEGSIEWNPDMLSHQNPGGTSSQAWSVGEVLRVLVEYGIFDMPVTQPIVLAEAEPDTVQSPALESA